MNRKIVDRPTITQVAELAKVSIATASRVLSNNGYPVNIKTRQRILETADRIQYIYSTDKMKKNKINESKSIGMIIPTITNQFYQQAILGIQSELELHSANLRLYISFHSEQKEEAYLQQLYKDNVNGVIISSMFQNSEKINHFREKGMIITMLDQIISTDDEWTHITFDHVHASELAVNYLVEKNHEQIAFVSSPLKRWTRKCVFEGFKQGLRNNGLVFDGNNIYIIDSEKETTEFSLGYEFQAGFETAERFVKKNTGATAIVIINDMMAMGFIKGLMHSGVRVPEDISVISFDNIPFAEMFSPALTTIHCPAKEMGQIAAKLLLNKLTNDTQASVRVKLEPRLVVRESVKDRR